MSMSLQVGKIISEQDFKYGNSDYAVNLRKVYGENGYKKYVAQMNSIMVAQKDLTNPIAISKEKYILEKKEQYFAALANFKKASSVWNEFKPQYNTNLNNAKTQNNGFILSGGQKQEALQSSGTGAVQAFKNFNEAEFEKDYALSLYNDATHSGINLST